MIEHWLSDDGRDAMEWMGWPEWDEDYAGGEHCRLLLAPDGGGVMRAWSIDDGGAIENMPTRLALALLRDCARERLMERDIVIDCDHICEPRYFFALQSGEFQGSAWKDDYDAALIAALLAVKETT